MVKVRVFQEDLRRLMNALALHEVQQERARTFFTTGRTHGLLSSSLYAPTPRLTFCGNGSSL